jgi:hypothetical protein
MLKIKPEFLLGAINLIAVVVLSTLSYKLNLEIKHIQENEIRKERATSNALVWGGIETHYNEIRGHFYSIGRKLSKFQISTTELLVTIDNEKFTINNIQHQKGLAKFYSAANLLKSDVAYVYVKYDFLIKKYSSLAHELKINGWPEFSSQSKNIIIWTNQWDNYIRKTSSTMNQFIKGEIHAKEATDELGKIMTNTSVNNFLSLPYALIIEEKLGPN